jgi:hypothetical protein
LSIWECHVLAIIVAMPVAIIVAIILATPTPFGALAARFTSAVALLDHPLALSLLPRVYENLGPVIEGDLLPTVKHLGHLSPVDVADYAA